MDELLQQGIIAYKTGKRDEARKLFLDVVKRSQDSELAWSWMYQVLDNDKERIYCVKQMLRINPNSEKNKLLLDSLTGNDFPFEVEATPEVPTPTQTYANNILPPQQNILPVNRVAGSPVFSMQSQITNLSTPVTSPPQADQRNLQPAIQQSAQSQPMKKCPYCAEMVLAEAEVCRYCGRNINPKVIQAEKTKALGTALQQLGCSITWLTILVPVLICLCLFLYLLITQ